MKTISLNEVTRYKNFHNQYIGLYTPAGSQLMLKEEDFNKIGLFYQR